MISVGHRNFHLTYRIVVFDMLYSLDVLKFLKKCILCCSLSELTTFICCIFMWKCLDLTWLGISISNIYLRLSRLPLNFVCTAAIFVCVCLMWGSQDIKKLLDRQAGSDAFKQQSIFLFLNKAPLGYLLYNTLFKLSDPCSSCHVCLVCYWSNDDVSRLGQQAKNKKTNKTIIGNHLKPGLFYLLLTITFTDAHQIRDGWLLRGG